MEQASLKRQLPLRGWSLEKPSLVVWAIMLKRFVSVTTIFCISHSILTALSFWQCNDCGLDGWTENELFLLRTVQACSA
jgi:hypothetical protein